jgi:hypothetical protein
MGYAGCNRADQSVGRHIIGRRPGRTERHDDVARSQSDTCGRGPHECMQQRKIGDACLRAVDLVRQADAKDAKNEQRTCRRED